MIKYKQLITYLLCFTYQYGFSLRTLNTLSQDQEDLDYRVNMYSTNFDVLSQQYPQLNLSWWSQLNILKHYSVIFCTVDCVPFVPPNFVLILSSISITIQICA